MTTAVVLSGGGIRGPLEVGALESLFEHGVKPDFFVGTSAGSLNSGYVAAFGAGLAAIPPLKDAWRKANRDSIYPGNALTAAWRVLTGKDGLFSSDGMRKFIADNLPPGVSTFGQLKCPAYMTAVDLGSRRLYLFGEDPAASLVDGMMASSSIPVLQPPVDYYGLQLVDGGVLAAAPAGVAMDKGATVIYSVNVGPGEEPSPQVHGVIPIFMRVLEIWLGESVFEDLERAAADPAILLHHIHITAFADAAFNDFSHTEEMFVAGKQAADAYLAHPQPSLVQPPAAVPQGPLYTVPGARQYVPWTRR